MHYATHRQASQVHYIGQHTLKASRPALSDTRQIVKAPKGIVKSMYKTRTSRGVKLEGFVMIEYLIDNGYLVQARSMMNEIREGK